MAQVLADPDALLRLVHSFPTRRSSDLRRARRRPQPRRPSRSGPAAARNPEARMRAVRDRKSTRLNSSHRCISYAVFCLKKKNQREQATADPDTLVELVKLGAHEHRPDI